MSKKLIICEKGSMAAGIAQILNCSKKDSLNYENDKYVITKLAGHIVQEKEMKDYEEMKKYENEKTGKLLWKDIKLPFIPETFQYTIKKETYNLYKNVLEQINRSDVGVIYNCGDPDNEGQVLAERPIRMSKTKKPVKRLFLNGINKTDLMSELAKDLDNDIPKYRGMYNAGSARAKIDWIYGMNMTVYVSVKSGAFMQVGRLKVPIIEFVYNRDKEIENFVPEKYFTVESNKEVNGEKINLVSKEKFDKDHLEDAKTKAKNLNSEKAKVIKKTTKDKTVNPPALLNAIGVHKSCSKTLGISPKIVETEMENLYLSGFISYPRSESQHIATGNKGKVKNIINNLINKGEKIEFKDNHLFNDEKLIVGHDAIIITEKIPNDSDLSDIQKGIYKIIFNRFCANFCSEECIVSETKLEIQVKNEKFNKTGSVIKQAGFTIYEKLNFNNNLPNLKEGEEFEVDFQPKEKMTTPPPKVTFESLTDFLANPFKKEKNKSDKENETFENDYMTEKELEDAKKGIKLGTPATTTPTIEECIKGGYIERSKKNVYSITKLGKTYIENINALNINLKPTRTAEINVMLQKIQDGTMKEEDVINDIRKELTELIENNQKNNVSVQKFSNKKAVANFEGKDVFEATSKSGKTFYYTQDKEMFLFKENYVMGNTISLSEKEVKDILAGKTIEKTLHSKEKNKDYQALIAFDKINEKKFATLKFAGFPQGKNSTKKTSTKKNIKK